jgi:hypothetical protein
MSIQPMELVIGLWILDQVFGKKGEEGASSPSSSSPALSPEHEAAHAVAKVLKESAAQNTAELKAAAPINPVVTPSGAPALPPATPATPPTTTPPVTAVVPTQQGPAVPAAAPFPAAAPPNLPPFPAGWQGGPVAGWRYATPVTPEVAKRAQALLPTLWASGAGTHTQEMTGGQWITYNAEWHDKAHGIKGVTAYTPKAAT